MASAFRVDLSTPLTSELAESNGMTFRKASQALQTFGHHLSHDIRGEAYLIQPVNSFVKELTGNHARSHEGFHAGSKFIFDGRWWGREAFEVSSRRKEIVRGSRCRKWRRRE